MKRVRRAGARVVLVVVALSALPTFVVAGATPAWAHATLISSSPGADERLAKAPADVTIQFDEPVSTSAGGVTVLDAHGAAVQQGSGRQPTSTTLRVKLKSGLPNGTYIANYNGISSDGHIVKGSIVFVVGSGAIADVSGLASHRDAFADDLNRAGQFLAYLGILLAAGLAFFLAFVHDGGSERRRLARVSLIAIAIGVVGIAVTIAGESSLASGKGIDSAFDGTTLRSVLRTGLGWQSAAQLAGLALCAASLMVGRQLARQVFAFYGGLAATAAFVLFGHTRTGDKMWLTIPADIVHVGVAGAWFGGLVGLSVVLQSRRGSDRRLASAAKPIASIGSEMAGAVAHVPSAEPATTSTSARTATALLSRADTRVASPRSDDDSEASSSLSSTVGVVRTFSTVAAVSVALLGIAGLALGYAEVGAFSRLTSTDYGRLLLIKVAIVAVIGLMAVYNRFFLLRRVTEPDESGAGLARAPAHRAVRSRWDRGGLGGHEPAGEHCTGCEPDPAVSTVRVHAGVPRRQGDPSHHAESRRSEYVRPRAGWSRRPCTRLRARRDRLPAVAGEGSRTRSRSRRRRRVRATSSRHGSSYLSISGTWVTTVQLALADGQQDVTFRDGLR